MVTGKPVAQLATTHLILRLQLKATQDAVVMETYCKVFTVCLQMLLPNPTFASLSVVNENFFVPLHGIQYLIGRTLLLLAMMVCSRGRAACSST